MDRRSFLGGVATTGVTAAWWVGAVPGVMSGQEFVASPDTGLIAPAVGGSLKPAGDGFGVVHIAANAAQRLESRGWPHPDFYHPSPNPPL